MAEPPNIEVGQIWKRNFGGQLIRIVREAFEDDWVWEPVDGGRPHSCYGTHLRRNYAPTPATSTTEDPVADPKSGVPGVCTADVPGAAKYDLMTAIDSAGSTDTETLARALLDGGYARRVDVLSEIHGAVVSFDFDASKAIGPHWSGYARTRKQVLEMLTDAIRECT